MKKRTMSLLLALALLTALMAMLAACKKEGGAEAKNLVASTFAIAADTVKEVVFDVFEKEAGVTVERELGNAAERFAKFESNPNTRIDTMELSQSVAAQAKAKDMFIELDYAKIPNAAKLIPSAKTVADQGLGLPYALNSVGIIYNAETAGMEVKEWADLWNPALAGKIAIPELTSTFGPHMIFMAGEYKGTSPVDDKGVAAFEALAELKPNIHKTYSRSSDVANMFQAGEIAVAVVPDFSFNAVIENDPKAVFVFPASGAYANFNTLNIPKSSKNVEKAYEFLNFRIGEAIEKAAAEKFNEAPVTSVVTLSDELAANMTYGDTASKAKVIDFKVVTENMESWIDQWNRLLNQ